ncbi:BA75_00331T0 [Komagataella pastoris]|uniref:BA75_00331T0 n=1 Tax=Komagataella pastoris TaxID=4922 RepID=A0A1B2J7Y4_PICPA|nr:BA75_00331T0 [Komagataella pastoris]
MTPSTSKDFPRGEDLDLQEKNESESEPEDEILSVAQTDTLQRHINEIDDPDIIEELQCKLKNDYKEISGALAGNYLERIDEMVDQIDSTMNRLNKDLTTFEKKQKQAKRNNELAAVDPIDIPIFKHAFQQALEPYVTEMKILENQTRFDFELYDQELHRDRDIIWRQYLADVSKARDEIRERLSRELEEEMKPMPTPSLLNEEDTLWDPSRMFPAQYRSSQGRKNSIENDDELDRDILLLRTLINRKANK